MVCTSRTGCIFALKTMLQNMLICCKFYKLLAKLHFMTVNKLYGPHNCKMRKLPFIFTNIEKFIKLLVNLVQCYFDCGKYARSNQ